MLRFTLGAFVVLHGLIHLFYFGRARWRAAILGSAAFAAVLFVLFWNGRMQRLDYQAGVGVLIDLTILAAVLVFRWPDFEF
jgi:hypothetical protein